RDVEDVAAHHPNYIREVECGVEQDQPDEGVDPAQPYVEEKDGEHYGDRRHHALRDDPVRQVLAAGAEAREAVCAERPDEHGEQSAAARDQEAVPHGGGIAVLEQHQVAAELNLPRPPLGWVSEDFLRRLERDYEQPVNREQKEERDERRGREAQGEL